ncbi:MAG: hypothetical protein KQA41_03890 [Candidatus Aenigmarchaeota archaeon]|nr:hypothetical protein [Candidatus Aenigmarchaeota archaeon]
MQDVEHSFILPQLERRQFPLTHVPTQLTRLQPSHLTSVISEQDLQTLSTHN